MSSTLTVQDGVNFTSSFINQQPLFVNNLQPALGIAQIIVNRMQGAPMSWRFNRGTISIAITPAGLTDYTISVADLGWIETQWLTDALGVNHDLIGAVSLPKVSTSRRPTKVAPVYDDNAGNITFRFSSVPDKNYTGWFDYQRKAPLIQSPGAPFGTFPDEFAHIFLTGYLTWTALLVRDNRFPIFEKMFLGSLLSAQSGLDAQAKAIFLGEWMQSVSMVMGTQARVNAGNTADRD